MVRRMSYEEDAALGRTPVVRRTYFLYTVKD